MPKDSKGNFHPNIQRAMHADKMGASAKPKPMGGLPAEPAMPAEHGGGSIPEHLAAMQAEHGGKHMHVHSDGMSHTTHHVGEDGQVQGPHEHESTEALKEHMGRFLDEEGQEPEHMAMRQKDVY